MKEQIEMLRKVKAELEKKADTANNENNELELTILESAIKSIRKAIIELNYFKDKK